MDMECSVPPAGAKFHAWLDLPEEVEDHRPGLHLLSSRREHEEEEPDCVHHGGSRGGVRPPALHPGQLLPQAAPHGRQFQEASHQPRRRQQHLPQQVQTDDALAKNKAGSDPRLPPGHGVAFT